MENVLVNTCMQLVVLKQLTNYTEFKSFLNLTSKKVTGAQFQRETILYNTSVVLRLLIK